MATYVIGIGSNAKGKLENVRDAIAWIDTIFYNVKSSSIYTTPATNGKDEDYANAVVKCDSDDELPIIQRRLKEYEQACGRTKESKIKGIVPIDLDIVICDNEKLRPRDYNAEYFLIGWRQING